MKVVKTFENFNESNCNCCSNCTNEMGCDCGCPNCNCSMEPKEIEIKKDSSNKREIVQKLYRAIDDFLQFAEKVVDEE